MTGPGLPFDAPPFVDESFAALFAPEAMLREYGRFEVALANASADEGLIPPDAARAIANAADRFEPDLEDIRAGIRRDGVAVPAYVRQLRQAVGEEHGSYVHLGATSQDVVDTALASTLAGARVEFMPRFQGVGRALTTVNRIWGEAALTGRTRMQPALPIRARDRILAWKRAVDEDCRRLGLEAREVEALQLGGPVGDRRSFEGKGDRIAARMARALALADVPCWHTDRSRIVRYGAWLATVAGTCGKIGQDVLLMAQGGEVRFAGGGESSVMAHKRNPVLAEALVTLARYAATLAGGLQHALVHEQERSGSAWSLEFLLLPPLCNAAAASLAGTARLLKSIRGIGQD